MMPPRQPLNIVRLSDHGGQFILMVKCGQCGHARDARPATFARLAGWETPLADPQTPTVLEVRRATGNRGSARRETKRDG